jgi:transcriptional regulator with XRE-family HTH domain
MKASASHRFATSIASVRNRSEMTTLEFAQKIGVSPTTLSKIGNNTANVQLETIAKFGRPLNIDPRTFFSPKTYPEPTANQLNELRSCVAANIRANRKRLGSAQVDMARNINLPKGYLGVIERTSPNLTLDVLERIAEQFSLSVSELLRPID